MLAAHAVTPRCPVCDRPVRSSVQIRSDMADLATLVNDSQLLTDTRSAPDPELRVLLLRAAEICAAELHAELRGEHLNCAYPDNTGRRIAAARELLDATIAQATH